MSGHSDVVIIGAGFAGTCLSHALADIGMKVLLIDRRFDYPNLFRAEKIEADQAEILRQFGLLEFRAPCDPPIGPVRSYDAISALETSFDTVEQYGIEYGATVNRLIAELPSSVQQLQGKVAGFHGSPIRGVVMDDGSVRRGDLIVLATGGSDRLVEAAGINRRVITSLRSLSFGFDIEAIDGQFDFAGFNYNLSCNNELLDYLTIFRIGDRMRVNLFSQLDVKAPLVRTLKSDMIGSLEQHFPALVDRIGSFRLASKVQVVPTTFARLHRPWSAGVIAIGEEHQAVSPTTGTGLSRALNDVAVLVRHATQWHGSGPVGEAGLKAYYSDAQKLASDRHAASAWMYYRNRHGPRRLATGMRDRLQILSIR
ncbi:MAG: FAD-dependent monooxygenase [Longimicrobiales bacterium]|nr:FAD-dependent monooxygenase [Longimicrobiales bacterium]